MKVYAVILMIGISFAFCLCGYKTYQSLTHPIKYENEVEYFCEKYDLDKAVVASLINVESSYNKNAKSNKNAIGLMQIKLETANYLNDLQTEKHITENDLFTPSININYGCKYLRYLINKFEDIYTSLAAYNAGETRVRSWLKSNEFSSNGKTLFNIPYTETKNYVKKIKNYIKVYALKFK